MGCFKYVLFDNFNEVVVFYLRREIKCIDVVKLFNMVRGIFLKYVYMK